jgi:riboflavin synthase
LFTGIVEAMGSVIRLQRRGGAIRLEVDAPESILTDIKIGDSIAVNGACVTVTDSEGPLFAADLVPETLGRTNLGTLQPGEEVNLERPLRADGRLDGHIVQGHVDVVGLVRSRRRVGAQELLEVNVPFELTRYLAPKGSVAVDGVSLTVVDVNKDRFRVALIPHTVTATTLGKKIQGQAVNVEVDVLSKYVERHVAARMPQRPPSIASLVAQHDIENRKEAATPPAPVPAVAPRPVVAHPPVMVVHQAPRSQPATRPPAPPRQQPPRFSPPTPKPSAAAKASAARAVPAAKKSKPVKASGRVPTKRVQPVAKKKLPARGSKPVGRATPAKRKR